MFEAESWRGNSPRQLYKKDMCMKKYFLSILIVTLIFNITSCSQNNEEQETQIHNNQETDEAESYSVAESEAVMIVTELIERANYANYVSAGICERNVNTVDLAGNAGNGVLENVIGAESVEDLEEYFYSVFESETAKK